MKKRSLTILIAFAFSVIFFIFYSHWNLIYAGTATITNISISPDLDISYFDNYNITANITNSSTMDYVELNLTVLNGDGGSCWEFFANGSCSKDTPTLQNLSLESVNFWKIQNIRPDTIYPQIEFMLDSSFWANSPQNTSLNKNSYQIHHFVNNFTVTPNMSFFIELSAQPESTSSKDVVVYLVGNGQNVSLFNSNWKNNPNVELVGSETSSGTADHIHTENASHYLIKLATDNNGLIGSNGINISGDFWVVVWSNGNSGKAWQYQYLNSSLCNTSNWYVENQSGVIPQTGCPNLHIHLARRTTIIDGINAKILANTTDGNYSESSTSFYFAPLPNFAPTASAFTNPVNGVYSGNINITWAATIDPNNDPVTYNLTLLNSDGSFNRVLNGSTTATNFLWDSSSVNNGVYDLRIVACDPSNACSNFTMGEDYYNFTISNSLSSSGGESGSTSGMPIYYVDSASLKKGYSKELGYLWRLGFELKNETHTLRIDSIDANLNKATISIFSQAQTKTLSVGEEWKVDLNNDSYEDLLVKVNNITSTKVNISAQEISEKILTETPNETFENKTGLNPKVNSWSKNVYYYLVGIGAVLILAFIILRASLSRKESKS